MVHARVALRVTAVDGRAAAMDEDDDISSPRTLRAAAERLAQYTSEEVAAGAEPVSGARFADLYSEVKHAAPLGFTIHLHTCQSSVLYMLLAHYLLALTTNLARMTDAVLARLYSRSGYHQCLVMLP